MPLKAKNKNYINKKKSALKPLLGFKLTVCIWQGTKASHYRGRALREVPWHSGRVRIMYQSSFCWGVMLQALFVWCVSSLPPSPLGRIQLSGVKQGQDCEVLRCERGGMSVVKYLMSKKEKNVDVSRSDRLVN